MASAPAVQHREKMDKAYAAMEILGLTRKRITPFLRNLLQTYNNEWDFIEAENYRLLADSFFDAQEPENSSRGSGPATRARQANSGSDAYDNSDDSFSPPRGSPPPENPPRPPPTTAAIHRGDNARSDTLLPVKREPNSPASGRAADATHTARAVEYHSGSSVRTRAASQIQNGSPGTRGRAVAHSSAGAAAAQAHEREKGKSPMGSQSQRPQLSPQPSPQQRRGKGLPGYVTVKLEVSCSSLPAPEGFEKVAFEKVNGEIRPAVRTPQKAADAPLKQAEQLTPVASPVKVDGDAPLRQAEQLTPVASPVKVDGETLHPQSNPKNQVLAPTPLLAKDPTSNLSIHIKTEPQEANAGPSEPSYFTCEDMSLDQSVQRELVLEETLQPSHDHLQIVPYGTVFADGPSTAEQPSTVIAGPSIDHAPKVELDEHERTVLPVDRSQEDGLVVSQVEREEDHSLEPPEQVTSGTCDLVLVPDESVEQVEPPELNDEEIRPNFIVSDNAKRDMVDEQVGGHPKRQRCEVSVPLKATPSTAPPRRRLILDESPATSVNEDSDCTIVEGPVTRPSSSAGVKRKLIISGSSSPEGSRCTAKDIDTSNGVHTMVRSGDVVDLVPDRCEDRVNVSHEARGRSSMNSAWNRVTFEPEVEDPNSQLKHDPRDISRGSERVPIPLVNEFTSENLNHNFNYIPSNVVYQNAYINISLARIGDEDFCFDCVGDCLIAPHSCPCTRETGGEFAYTEDGRLKPALIQHELDTNQDLGLKDQKCMVFCSSGWTCPIERTKVGSESDYNPKCKGHLARKFVKECWHKCGCNMRCGNRVVQRGISRRLEVFFTNDGKGWGLRTAEDLPAGSFVCEYVGEILTNTELDQRNVEAAAAKKTGSGKAHKDTYPVLLDGDWASESGLKDEEALCLDATRYGNVARFINHRCSDANLIDVPVSIEGLDRHYYHVAFFTSRHVRAGEELTWDYRIDFDDDEHPIEAFRCLCKSEQCRDGGATATKKKKKYI